MTIQPSIPLSSDSLPPNAAPTAEAQEAFTQMMEQYLEIKAANPGLLLFYRMGDFYELFFEDAELASKALGIALTKRGKHQGADIPMCGVPVERSEDYLHRLIAKGFRVAVCEQMEDPAAARARGNKSVVRRGVVRRVTLGLVWICISTTEFTVTECAGDGLAATWARINPNEAVVADALYGDTELGPL